MAKRNDITPSSLPCVIEYRLRRAAELIEAAQAMLNGVVTEAMDDAQVFEFTKSQVEMTLLAVADLGNLAPSKKPLRKEG
jgi:hypothetical protein